MKLGILTTIFLLWMYFFIGTDPVTLRLKAWIIGDENRFEVDCCWMFPREKGYQLHQEYCRNGKTLIYDKVYGRVFYRDATGEHTL